MPALCPRRSKGSDQRRLGTGDDRLDPPRRKPRGSHPTAGQPTTFAPVSVAPNDVRDGLLEGPGAIRAGLRAIGHERLNELRGSSRA